MAVELPKSTEAPTAETRRIIETLAGLSGVLLFAYISGRIYLQAYYSAFHTESSDLNLSIQDIMFQAAVSLLGPVLVLLLLVVSLPWLRSVALVQRLHQGVGARARDYLARSEAMRERIAAARLSANERLDAAKLSGDERNAAGTFSGPEFEKELTALTAEIDVELKALEVDVDAMTTESEEIHRDMVSVDKALEATSAGLPIPGLLAKPLAVLGSIHGLAWAAAGSAVVVLGFASYIYSQYGLASALWVAAGIASAMPAVLGLQWLGQRLSDQADHRGWIDYTAPLLLGAYSVLALPFFTGFSIGRFSRSADVGLATVVLTTDHPLNSSWTANGTDFVSPQLRLLGRNGTFLVVWDPTHPDKSYSVPLVTIRGIERGGH